MAENSLWVETSNISVPEGPFIGLSWSGDQEAILTTASQAVIHCTRSGNRLKEYTFRPSGSTSFTRPATRVGNSRMLVAVQGKSRIVLWDQDDASAPPKVTLAEAPFTVQDLVVTSSLVWAIGSGDEVAVYHATSLQLAARHGSAAARKSEGQVAACVGCVVALEAAVILRQRDLAIELLWLEEGRILTTRTAALLPNDSTDAKLVSSGMTVLRRASGSTTSEMSDALVWFLWGDSAGRVSWSMTRVQVVTDVESEEQARNRYMLRVTKVFTRELHSTTGEGELGEAASRKRRRSQGEAAAGLWQVLGLPGLALALVRGPNGGVRLWDIQHGVPLGPGPGLSQQAGQAAGPPSAPQQWWWSAPSGSKVAALCCGPSGGVTVTVLSLAGERDSQQQQQGLRGVLGKASALAPPPGPQGVSFGGTGAGWVVGPKATGPPPPQGPADLVASIQQALTVDKGATSSKARKRAREQAAPPSELAGSVPVPVALCWSLLAQVLDEPSAEGWAVLGRVLERQGAAVVVGDVMRRERPLLLEELAAHGQWALVTKVLHHKTTVQVPERGLVGVIKTALYSGMKRKALVSLLGVAIARPVCPAFLRSALCGVLDSSSSALLLAALFTIIQSRPVEGGATHALSWVEALLDCRLVDLVLEGAASLEVACVLRALRDEAQAQVQGVEALEDMAGRIEQLQRPQAPDLQAVPDYSLETWDLA